MRDSGVGVIVWGGGFDEGCRVGVVLCRSRGEWGKGRKIERGKTKKRTTTFKPGKF